MTTLIDANGDKIPWFLRLRVRILFYLLPTPVLNQILYDQNMAIKCREVMKENAELRRKYSLAETVRMKLFDIGGEDLIDSILDDKIKVTDEKVWMT